MDINLLAVNVGNSRIAFGTFIAGECKFVTRAPVDDYAAAMTSAWEPLKSLDDVKVVGGSVNPGAMEKLEHELELISGTRVLWVGREIEVPVEVKTEDRASTGVDRIVNISAAYEQMGKACVVVDAGTAITIDCCDDGGAFLGGAIAPGVAMQLDALHEKTARLPRVAMQPPVGPFGNSTEQAIRQGVFYGVRGMVKELVEQYATALGNWPDIIATGGDAAMLFADWELIHAVSPDLTLYGIALAYTNHAIKNDE